jgi:DNA repair protein RadA/Sms
MCSLADIDKSALYVTGEESLQQVGMRAQRLSLPQQKLKLLAETNVEQICLAAQEHKPSLLVVDSIQVMHSSDVPSAPGSVSQVRECAAYLISMPSKPIRFSFWWVTSPKKAIWPAPRFWST